jgi:hypothetical protein
MKESGIRIHRESEEVTLVAMEKGENIGFLNYFSSQEVPQSYEIAQIATKKAHPQAALALVRTLAETLGPDMPISATIANEPTLAVLRDKGFIDEALRTGELEITDEEILSAVPMVRGLRIGGIIARKITITPILYDPDTQFTIELSGITRPVAGEH